MIQYYNNVNNLMNISEDTTGDQITLFLVVRIFKPQNFKRRVFPLLDIKQDQDFRTFTNDDSILGLHYLSHVRL